MSNATWSKVGALLYFALLLMSKIFGSGHFEMPGPQVWNDILASGALTFGILKASGTDGQK